MKIKRTISEKVVAANRANAKKSTGAKTVAGKKNMRGNGQKHGLFARELLVLEGERAVFETLRRDLATQFLPKTALQNLALEEIVCCAWRCKLAARLEMRQLRASLGDIANQEGESAGSRDEIVVGGWYGANRQTLRSGMRLLSQLRAHVSENGRVPETLKEPVVNACGAEFYDALTCWLPVSVDALYLTDQLLGHSRTYNLPLPELEEKREKGVKVVLDYRERLHMTQKLIDQEIRHLEDLDKSYEQRMSGTSRAGPLGFAPGYFSTAMRDFHRAIDRFSLLKRARL